MKFGSRRSQVGGRRSEVAFSVAALLIVTGCTRSSAAPRQKRPAPQVQTIDSASVRPSVLDPPPILTDEGPAPKPKIDATSPDAPPPPTPQDEALRASLPFSPAIALDPVTGMKISIRANTVMADYKGHMYYFESEQSKRTFLATPEQYTKGVFAH